jgi:type I restriction enzyme, S subunit
MKPVVDKIQKYPAYKDSGVEWLGEIPKNWEIRKLKFIANFINRGITPIYVESSNCKVINQATFSRGFFDISNIKFSKEIKEDLIANKGKVKKGDILLASTGGGVLGKVAFFDLEDNSYQADSHVTIIRGCEPNFMSKYFFYILSISYDLINNVLAQGSTNQTELQRDWFINFQFPVPTFSEQTTIASFLDRQTALIDKAINIKEKQIELLKERRQIIIHKAVTRGLNPKVKTKESGVDWIGEIPEHWEIKALRFLGVTQNGVSKGAEYFGTGYPFVSYGDVYRDIELPSMVNGLAESSINDRKQYSVIEGDVLFTRTSETIEEIGFSSTC